MLIIKIAFRNIFRQKRRSFFTALTMMGGFILFSLALSISEGTYGTVIEKFTKSYTGHIQLHKKGYFDKPSLYNTFDNFEFLDEKLRTIPGLKSWTPRVFSAALASKDKKTSMARIIGINPIKEAQTTAIKQKIREGIFLQEHTELNHEVMIGAGLAEMLNAKIGDEIVLVGQGADGSVSNDLFKVAAILKGDAYSADRNYCYMDIKMAQSFLSLEKRIHEVTVIIDDYNHATEQTAIIKKSFNDHEEVEIFPWQVIEKQFFDTMTFEKRGVKICLSVIVLIVAIGVLNTVLMSILERTVEYGVLRALGTRPLTLFILIVLESSLLAMLSIFAGFILSFIINYWLSIHGIDYPAPMEIGGFSITTMYGLIYPGAFVGPAIVTLFTACFVSIFPAIRAMKIVPVEAMRMT